METLDPRDPREVVALFRAEIIGAVANADLKRGELKHELKRLSSRRFRPPGSDSTRTYAVPTLQRWYYAYRQGGLRALEPRRRRDHGHGRKLNDAQKELLLDIRREHPNVDATLILDTLVRDGRIDRSTLSAATLQRLYVEHELPRLPRGKTHDDQTQRLRWQAEHPNALWQGDVCHGPTLTAPDGRRIPIRVHALLDDASRYGVALEAHETEREIDMIGVLTGAIRRSGQPGVLYLDNGSTYRGDALRLACARLGVSLVHPQPRDPQARGKIERFFRTLRARCLDHVGTASSLHEVNVRLWAFLDEWYQDHPHAGLIGKTPREVWKAHWHAHPDDLQRPAEESLRGAMTVRKRRRVRADSTLSHAGVTWEIRRGFFCKKVVTVAHCLLDEPVAPWVEHDGREYPLHPVDPVQNATRGRKHPPKTPRKSVDFDPATTTLKGYGKGRGKGDT